MARAGPTWLQTEKRRTSFPSADLIAKFDETGTSNENGIYAVTANVTVHGEKLLEAVTFGNDSAELDKEMQEARLGSDIEETREKMTKYVSSYMLDFCRIWSITVKELIPGHDNNGQSILQANCYFGTSPAKYQMYISRLNNAMARMGGKRAPYKHELYKNFNSLDYIVNPDAQKPNWTIIWLPKKYFENERAFDAEFQKWGYKITVKLLDEAGDVIKTQDLGFQFYGYNNLPFPGRPAGSMGSYRLFPLKGEHKDWCYRTKCNFTFNDFASSEEMLKVKKMLVSVEPVKKVREPLLDFRQYLNKDMKWGWIER